jgi:hypothetical protein
MRFQRGRKRKIAELVAAQKKLLLLTADFDNHRLLFDLDATD